MQVNPKKIDASKLLENSGAAVPSNSGQELKS
jgi:hypothetical protein